MTQGRSLAIAAALLIGAAALFTYSRIQPPKGSGSRAIEPMPQETPVSATTEDAGDSRLDGPPEPTGEAPPELRASEPRLNASGPPPPRQRSDEPPTEKPPPLPDYLRNNPPPVRVQDLPDPQQLREQFLLLRKFLELPPARLKDIRESIERIEKMPPERKEMMLSRIRGVNPPGTPSTQEEKAAATQTVDRTLQIRADAAIAVLPEEAQKKVRKHIADLNPEQRAAFLEGLALQHELSGSIEDRLFQQDFEH